MRRGVGLAVVAAFAAVIALILGGRAEAAPQTFVQQGNRIVASGEIGNGWFGFKVALSADGKTALVGGHEDGGMRGAAWIFRRSASGWTQEQKLTPKEDTGFGEIGSSVALSADGGTALVGARSDDGGAGAAYVFVRVRDTAPQWEEEAKLSPNVTQVCDCTPRQFGASVALSGDGNIALIGAPSSQSVKGGLGLAFVFTRSNRVWTNQTRSFPLTSFTYSQTARFGASVALSPDASSAYVGAPGQSFVWWFIHEGIAYLETAKGMAPPVQGAGPIGFGDSVATSADGKTVLVGAPLFGNGIAWAYVFNGKEGAQAGFDLQRGFIPLDTTPGAQLGAAVALSTDGNTALIGGPGETEGRGAAWAYRRTATNWEQLGGRIEAGGEVGAGAFGTSVALAADGNSALIGGPKHDGGIGAIWAFGNRATVTSMSPRSGPATGGTQVTLAGRDFENASGVRFGTVPATSFTVLSGGLLRAVAPAHSPGTVDVTIVNSAGASLATAADRFTFLAPAAPTAFRATYARRTLFLRWQPQGDVRVDHFDLLRNGKLRRRLPATSRRTALRGFKTKTRVTLTLVAVDADGNRSAPARLRVIRRKKAPRESRAHYLRNPYRFAR